MIKDAIQSAIQQFFNKDWCQKDFLTEDDLRCHLFILLKEELMRFQNVSVHAEIRWYGDAMNRGENKLRYRSDIVIIDSNDLQIDESLFRLPSKGYGFNRYYSVIEIKLRRPNDKNSDIKYDLILSKDVGKLKKIRDKTTGGGINNKSYFLIAFDKKKKRKILKEVTGENNTINWQVWNRITCIHPNP